MEGTLAEENERFSESDIRLVGGACVAAGAMFAYLAQPVLRFADPVDLVCLGGAAASLLIGLWSSLVGATNSRKQWKCVIAAAVVMVLFLTVVLAPALVRSRTHDRRCRQIESQMMEGTGTRADLPDLFAALQCRPQLMNR